MTIQGAITMAKAGVPVKRVGWAADKYLAYEQGAGTTRAVAVIVEAGVMRVVQNDDIQSADFNASDWQAA